MSPKSASLWFYHPFSPYAGDDNGPANTASAFTKNSHPRRQDPLLIIVILPVRLFDPYKCPGNYCCFFKNQVTYILSLDSEPILITQTFALSIFYCSPLRQPLYNVHLMDHSELWYVAQPLPSYLLCSRMCEHLRWENGIFGYSLNFCGTENLSPLARGRTLTESPISRQSARSNPRTIVKISMLLTL